MGRRFLAPTLSGLTPLSPPSGPGPLAPPRVLTPMESAGKRPKAAWHCKIASLQAQIPKIFSAPAARQACARSRTSLIVIHINVTVTAAGWDTATSVTSPRYVKQIVN